MCKIEYIEICEYLENCLFCWDEVFVVIMLIEVIVCVCKEMVFEELCD